MDMMRATEILEPYSSTRTTSVGQLNEADVDIFTAYKDKKLTTPNSSFPFRLHKLLSENYENIISWLECGEMFRIYNKDRLENEVLPLYFNHKKFSSFQKQLSIYGFNYHPQTLIDLGGYSHQYFKQGREDLLQLIERLPQKCDENKSRKYAAIRQGNKQKRIQLEEGDDVDVDGDYDEDKFSTNTSSTTNKSVTNKNRKVTSTFHHIEHLSPVITSTSINTTPMSYSHGGTFIKHHDNILQNHILLDINSTIHFNNSPRANRDYIHVHPTDYSHPYISTTLPISALDNTITATSNNTIMNNTTNNSMNSTESMYSHCLHRVPVYSPSIYEDLKHVRIHDATTSSHIIYPSSSSSSLDMTQAMYYPNSHSNNSRSYYPTYHQPVIHHTETDINKHQPWSTSPSSSSPVFVTTRVPLPLRSTVSEREQAYQQSPSMYYVETTPHTRHVTPQIPSNIDSSKEPMYVHVPSPKQMKAQLHVTMYTMMHELHSKYPHLTISEWNHLTADVMTILLTSLDTCTTTTTEVHPTLSSSSSSSS